MARFWLVGLAACGSATAPVEKPVVAPDHELHVDVVTGADGLHVTIVGHAAELAHAPIAGMSGTADVAVDVVVPADVQRAKGVIDLRCVARCAISDLAIDDFELHATIGDGKLEIAKWTAHVAGVELAIAGRIELAHSLGESVINGCARFRAVNASDNVRALVAVTGAPVASDGFYNIRLAGHVGDMHRLGQICDGSVPMPADLQPDTAEPPPAAHEQEHEHELDLGSIRQLGPNKYSLDKALFDQLFANPMATKQSARVVPRVKDGKPYGFKLYAIRAGSVFAKLGLENGDTLVTINGLDLTSPDKALEVFTKLRDATQIELAIERNGVHMTIDYVVD